jgi:hypothetical protein
MTCCPTNPKPKSTGDFDGGASRFANSKLKSTAGSPKSTVDLGIELLIRVENGLQSPVSPAYRHPFRPITTRQWRHANQKQTDADQKIFTCLLLPLIHRLCTEN